MSLQVDGQSRFLSQPGWDGSSHVSLLELGGDGQPSGWSVQVDEGQLVLIGRELSDPLLIDDLRADFPVFRQFEADGRALKVHFQPAAYPREFCRAWSREGDEYAERVAAYLFDHRPD